MLPATLMKIMFRSRIVGGTDWNFCRTHVAGCIPTVDCLMSMPISTQQFFCYSYLTFTFSTQLLFMCFDFLLTFSVLSFFRIDEMHSRKASTVNEVTYCSNLTKFFIEAYLAKFVFICRLPLLPS